MTIAPRHGFKRVTIHLPSEELQTMVVRGTGFRQACECGAVIYARKVSDLRVKMREHRAGHE